MEKLIILSIVVVSFVVPLSLAVARYPRKALRRTQAIVFLYIVVWAYLCTRWYPQLVQLK